MSLRLSLGQLSRIMQPITVTNSVNLTTIFLEGISTDSRFLQPGEAFLALKGENFDGHDFIESALSRGAIALIVDQDLSVKLLTQIPLFRVNNTLTAYQEIAHWWRTQLSIPVVGVTGSVGKTTTKELIGGILATQGRVLKTEGNYNNEIGVPKTLLKIDSSHDYAVIEMAMRGRGEIARLTQIASPTIGVITNVGTAHIGRLGSIDAIARAKCELLAQMQPTGVAVLNHDNQKLMTIATEVWRGETVTFGLEGGDICGKLLDQEMMRVDGVDLPLPLKGRHNALNYLGAIAVAKVLGVDLFPLTQGLEITIPGGRAKTYQLESDIWILDETYNAGLESMLAALELLQQTPGKRRIAVLGTMKELGEHGLNFHQQVGEVVKKLGIDYLCVYADEEVTKAIATGATGVQCAIFNNHQELLTHLRSLIQPGDRLLFKASRSVQLDRVVQQLIV
ncbi:UDP-N-acetylmuramoyl-tripeptide--D-alanyl-D-alanine ligase [Gloeocapsa sp. PCC 73106]|uniref:UDP-N-acetylmuramoyl-tripeptide--D-alanyl-D- alanine ligase n=1 Tax=Gloeocapsa sp. PCC 73106 TaxID=102232 RepID=UPI0002ABF589|nr:UDP-N-acetylmuramoyl-tripeptide--D-alanyl-D-alanine ligase [Gloeocapsa sp. PCC 73106]ELR96928.1 UDP-N-acetylmuramoyl-tripeptide--D-alanyl-D-alanine ligase [Gloeocapsa sp. PCC 73106]